MPVRCERVRRVMTRRSKGARVGWWLRNGQARHQRRGDVRGHVQPHQIVRDQAVHQSEQAPLRPLVEVGLQTEHGVRGDDVGRQHGGDQRQLVGGARDVAIGDAGAREWSSPVSSREAALHRNRRGWIARGRPGTARAACLRRSAAVADARSAGERSAADRRSRSARGRTGRPSPRGSPSAGTRSAIAVRMPSAVALVISGIVR